MWWYRSVCAHENSPDRQLGERMDAALWVMHPYRDPVVGWMNEVSSLTRQDALDFYESWYSPENAIVIISGDVKAAEAIALAREHYGALPGKKRQERVRSASVLPQARSRIDMGHPNVSTPRWSQYHRVPSVRTAKSRVRRPPWSFSRSVRGKFGLLYRDLVIERRVAVETGAGYDAYRVDDSNFLSLCDTPEGYFY